MVWCDFLLIVTFSAGIVSSVELSFFLFTFSNVSQLTYFLIGPPAIARRVLWIRSVFLYGCVLEIGSLVFSGTQHGVRGLYGVMTAWFFEKNIFISKNGENRPSLAFFECTVHENLVIFFLNFVYDRNLYQLKYAWKNFGKFCFLRYVPKSDFLHVDTHLLKINSKILGWAWS